VKVAISLPDDLFRAIDTRARALKLSRSAFLARAAREFLEAHGGMADPTDAWNQAIALAGQPGDEPGAMAARRRTRSIVRGSGAKAKW
jgi:metal-responsive CopG/Arc/MetJ family transcriptional regulator